MFYISPWTLLGLIFCTAYFVLVLCGFGRKDDQRKVSQKSNRESVSSTKRSDHVTKEEQARIKDQKLDCVDLGNESEGGRSDTQRQIREGTISSEIPNAINSFESSKQAPAHSDKGDNLTVTIAAVKREAALRSRDALYPEEDFVTEREKIRGRENKTSSSNANEYNSEFSGGSTEHFEDLKSSRENQGEISDIVTRTLVSRVSSAPEENNFAAFENEQPVLHSEPCVDVGEPNCSKTDLNKNSLFGDFAEVLVSKAKTTALCDINLELRASVLAENISTQIVHDAIGQLSADSGKEEFDARNVQEIRSFAGDVINSLFQGATGKVAMVKDVESFAKDLSEQIISEGVDIYAAKQKFEQGRKKKVSLGEIRIFSEDVVSEVLSDGIEEASVLTDANKDNSTKENNAQVMDLEDPVPHNVDSLTDEVCQVAYQEVAVSSSLQPHISGVVENLVNGAIYEASLRVRACRGNESSQESEIQAYSPEILESQVNETVKELIFSAVNEAADHEKQKSSIAQETMPMIQNELESQVGSYVDDALQNAVSEAAVKVLEGCTEATQEHRVLNGHVDLSQDPVVEEQNCQSTPEDVVLVGKEIKIADQSEGYDIVPLKDNNEQTELTGQKSGDFWRRSLISDLEEDKEFDKAVESEKSLPSAGDSTSPLKDEELIFDEDAEFIDSSEDEVIDYAEDAKLGAVGGSNMAKYRSNYDDRPDIEEDFDDTDEEDDDDTDDDDNEELCVSQSVVDGLCTSKPKKYRQRKKKHKTLPRARIQSAGSHYNNAVVIDNGCGTIKLGMAGEKKPSIVQPALYGVPKRYSLQMAGLDNKKDRQFGDAAAMKAGVMQLEYPMKAGLIENWCDIEDIWEYMLYSELGIEEGSNPILITEVANTPKKNREKMAEILFEHLSAPAMYLANQLVLSLYASGLTVGMCLSSGFSVTQAAAIYEGCLLAHTVQELDIGGQSLTDNLQKLLRDNKGHNFNASSGWQIVNNMKENMAYVAQDYPRELHQYKTSDTLTRYFKLPDGQSVDISSEMITTAEPLFNPETLLGADDTVASQFPIHKLVNKAFGRCSPELQSVMSRNVVLSGGTTLMRGLVPRLEHELSKINPKIRTVSAPDNRRYSAWIGGSILGALSTIDSMYVTIDEYADYGGRIVNQKCL